MCIQQVITSVQAYMRTLSKKKTSAKKKKEIVQNGGFLSAFLAPLASTVLAPMELIGNVDRRRYLRQATPPTPRSRIPHWTPLARTPPTPRNRSPRIPGWTPTIRQHMARSRTALDDCQSYEKSSAIATTLLP